MRRKCYKCAGEILRITSETGRAGKGEGVIFQFGKLFGLKERKIFGMPARCLNIKMRDSQMFDDPFYADLPITL